MIKHAGEFAVRAGRRLQGHRREAADLLQPLLQFIHQRQVALHGFHRAAADA